MRGGIWRLRGAWVVCALLLMTTQGAYGQDGCISGTGNNATVLVPSAALTGLQEGDVVEVRYDALCVGTAAVGEGQNMALTVWGDDTSTAEVDGIPVGAALRYEVLPAAGRGEPVAAEVTYEEPGAGVYQVNGILRVATFSAGQVLPVELTGLHVVVEGPRLELRWQTQSETNNAGFAVERWAQGTFEQIAFVPGRGTTQEPQAYRYAVEDAEPGRHRFRLRQFDLDGQATYSDEIEAVVVQTESLRLSAAYPNPAAVSSALTLSTREAQDVSVVLYDLQGRRVRTLFEGSVPAGHAETVQLEAAGLAAGQYFVRARGRRAEVAQAVTLVP